MLPFDEDVTAQAAARIAMQDALEKLARGETHIRLSGLGLTTLDRVFTEELEPLLAANLRTPAGEWAGFDIEWLEARIREQQGSGWRQLIERGRQAIGGGSAARDEWARLREMLSAQGRTTS